MSQTIEAQHLSLRYKEKLALNDLSFKLEGAKIFGLLGRNGSGKTSLLTILASYIEQTSGTIRINGQEPFENAEMMRQVCLVQENGYLSQAMTVKDVMKLSGDCWPNWDEAYAQRLIEKFELPGKLQLQKLSRGMKSALGITVGLASRAPFTIFDEAYLGLDAPSRYFFYDELLSDYMEHPRTIILSTHLIEEVSKLFEEVLILDQGKLLLQAEIEELLQQGCTVTGRADHIDEFAMGLPVLNEQKLGSTKSIIIYGKLSQSKLTQASVLGLTLGPIALQDLFVHLTQKGGRP
ncbi:ABC transporter ATP-binding protein [Paenibacillus sp. HB172176]|uniref:ABC transporter ATP-binding protein n=1 Tax=Paenibacillus sp. HB172176 TaxID=2493690 RepID=UPI00143C1E3E|nr:ABC transporter ATP-binding protein [Paenibacillus sp. HB172176]